jgi:NTP pyrophosphatase (non-canonical NTP hydrolase)
MDQETTMIELKDTVSAFVKARSWRPFHDPKNLSMSIAIEAAELMEHFQWLTSDEGERYMKDAAFKDKVSDELADILIYCLSFANHTDIDLSDAIRNKMEKNESRFPASKAEG